MSHASLHPQHLQADEEHFQTPSSSSSPTRLHHLHESRRLPITASDGKKVPFGSGRAAVWVCSKIIVSGRQRLSNTIHVSINQPSALTVPRIYLSNNHTYPAPPPGQRRLPCLIGPLEGANAPSPEPRCRCGNSERMQSDSRALLLGPQTFWRWAARESKSKHRSGRGSFQTT